MNIETSARFERHYQKLSQEVRDAAKRKEDIFRENPYHPGLRTHPLHGKDKDAWAFWINQKYRIKFLFLSPSNALFLDIGTHDIYE